MNNKETIAKLKPLLVKERAKGIIRFSQDPKIESFLAKLAEDYSEEEIEKASANNRALAVKNKLISQVLGPKELGALMEVYDKIAPDELFEKAIRSDPSDPIITDITPEERQPVLMKICINCFLEIKVGKTLDEETIKTAVSYTLF